MTSAEPAGNGCPVVDYKFIAAQIPALSSFAQMDRLRAETRPALRTNDASGYWVFTDGDVIREGLQNTELFSSTVIVPTEPNPPYKWIPVMLDPPDHSKWRRVLASYFSPTRVHGMETAQRGYAGDLIDSFAAKGECDLVNDFGRIFPSTIFLEIMGMPPAHLDQFLAWEHQIMHGDPKSPTALPDRRNGMAAVMGYFNELIAERRANPIDDAHDIVSDALTWTIDGEPISDGDLLNCMLLLFMAGLDTVVSQLSYVFLHLATHPEDRHRIVEDPSLIPHAIEELLRIYPIVQTARKVTRDAEFHGCPVKAGDMAAFPLAAAGRDENVFPGATTLDFERLDTRHISFGAGPHRCLGSHLARQELIVAVSEWHRRIPDYELVGEPVEHSGGVYGLDNLQLRWTV